MTVLTTMKLLMCSKSVHRQRCQVDRVHVGALVKEQALEIFESLR